MTTNTFYQMISGVHPVVVTVADVLGADLKIVIMNAGVTATIRTTPVVHHLLVMVAVAGAEDDMKIVDMVVVETVTKIARRLIDMEDVMIAMGGVLHRSVIIMKGTPDAVLLRTLSPCLRGTTAADHIDGSADHRYSLNKCEPLIVLQGASRLTGTPAARLIERLRPKQSLSTWADGGNESRGMSPMRCFRT